MSGPFSTIAAGIAGLASRRQMKREYRYNVAHAARAMDFEAAQAQKQMDFQRDMSNTAYQRAAADLDAAGLNRILAIGSPAAAQSGAMGRGHKASQSGGPDVAANMARAATAVSTIKEQNARIALLKETARKEKASADKEEITRLPYSWMQDIIGSESHSGKDAVGKIKSVREKIKEGFEDIQGKSKFLMDHYGRKVRNTNERMKQKARDLNSKRTVIHINKGNDQ